MVLKFGSFIFLYAHAPTSASFLYTMPKIQRSSYSAAEKLKVLQYAKDHGTRVAARHFNIDHSMISRRGKI